MARVHGVKTMMPQISTQSAVLDATVGVLALTAIWIFFRVSWSLRALRGKRLLQSISRLVWAPHTTTLVIGLTWLAFGTIFVNISLCLKGQSLLNQLPSTLKHMRD
jgi:hypothetical protein